MLNEILLLIIIILSIAIGYWIGYDTGRKVINEDLRRYFLPWEEEKRRPK